MSKYYHTISLWDAANNVAKTNKAIYDEIAEYITAHSELTIISREDTPGLSVDSQKVGISDGLRVYAGEKGASGFFGNGGQMTRYTQNTGTATIVIGEDRKSFGIGFSEKQGFTVDCFYSKTKNILTGEEKGLWIGIQGSNLYSLLDTDETETYARFGMPASTNALRNSTIVTLSKLFSPVENVLSNSLFFDFFGPGNYDSILAEIDGKIYVKSSMGTNYVAHGIWMPVLEQ